MKSTFQDLQTFIVRELLAAYKRRETETLCFNSLLKSILETYELSLLSDSAGYEVRGENGYNTITDMLYILKRMSNMGIILYHNQGKPSTTIDDMDYSNPELHSSGLKITEDVAEYLKDCVGKSIWISPEIENFAINGYVSEEIALAREQSRDAKKSIKQATLAIIISIISLVASIVIPLLCGNCNCGC